MGVWMLDRCVARDKLDRGQAVAQAQDLAQRRIGRRSIDAVGDESFDATGGRLVGHCAVGGSAGGLSHGGVLNSVSND